MHMSWRLAAGTVLAVVALIGGLHAGAHSGRQTSPRTHARSRLTLTPQPARPNIVFVLTDDLSFDLLPYMPEVQALQRDGMSFSNYFVSDSLCCPSRSSIFTGDFPHDTGVFTNVGRDGGIRAFYLHDDEDHTFNLALQRAGYQTAMMGKYLNGYLQPKQSPVSDTYIPPGWNEWDVAGDAYSEFDYDLNEDGTIQHYGDAPDDYLTHVLTLRADDFIRREADAENPFFLEVATFAPHRPYTPAPRYADAFPGLQAPEPPNFDRLPENPPDWLLGHGPLTPDQITEINTVFQKRVEAVQSVDDLIASVEQTLAAKGILDDTYIVFSSDNGLHTGEYRLMPGKLTAYDTDIHVPLVVAGPGVPADSSTDAMTENIDLAKTFTEIGGTTLPSDGHSLLDLLHGADPTDWRDAILVEHHGPSVGPDNPDAQSFDTGNPTTYEAVRTPDYLYVEYADGEREFYDLRTDPYELDNIAGELPATELAQLHQELLTLENCHGGDSCWAASHVPLGTG
jgi:N-acetylglucosamine-6-sulfatase